MHAAWGLLWCQWKRVQLFGLVQLSSTSSCRRLEPFEWEVFFTSQKAARISQPKNCSAVGGKKYGKWWTKCNGVSRRVRPVRLLRLLPSGQGARKNHGILVTALDGIFGLGWVHVQTARIATSLKLKCHRHLKFCSQQRRRKTPEPSKYFTRARLSRWWQHLVLLCPIAPLGWLEVRARWSHWLDKPHYQPGKSWNLIGGMCNLRTILGLVWYSLYMALVES